MTLRTVQVPNPPAGEDWSTTVPGRYLYNVTGITANLTTGGPNPVMVDSSGNGNDGVYIFTNAIYASRHLHQPGLVAGGFALRPRDVTPPDTFAIGLQPAGVPVSLSGDLSVDFLVQVDAACTVFTVPFVDFTSGQDLSMEFTDGFDTQVFAATTTAGFFAPAPIFDGAIHHVAMTAPAAGPVRVYIDGVALAVVFAPARLVGPTTTFLATSPSGPILEGLLDELAVYQSVLSPTRIAAHIAAAGVDQAAYTAAVLADAPAEYFHFDDQPGGVDQAVTLEVAEANIVVEQIPTGFNVVPGAGVYAFSWQTKLAAGAQIPSGSHTTVALPPLILPAGYVLRSHTYGIGPDDQWSDIIVWWNDDAMMANDAWNPFVYAPGAHLIYRRVGA